MKYPVGTFTTVPNMDLLKTMNPHAQAIYLWICRHSDQNGESFPSIETLCDEGGIKSKTTVFKYLKQLKDAGLLEYVHRFKDNEQTSNLYRIVVKQMNPVGTADVHRTKTKELKKPQTPLRGAKGFSLSEDNQEKEDTGFSSLMESFKHHFGFSPKSRSQVSERNAIRKLLVEYDESHVESMLEFCSTVSTAPRVGNFRNIWKDRGRIESGMHLSKFYPRKRRVLKHVVETTLTSKEMKQLAEELMSEHEEIEKFKNWHNRPEHMRGPFELHAYYKEILVRFNKWDDYLP
ncbi:helix-turn-helix domain-containing protein [Patescibacteria group bacterium]|nr:helix-turn-helix domain-containing protein [Patescibacteria group bacterium]